MYYDIKEVTMTNTCTLSASCFNGHRCAGAIQTASPNAACPGLLQKPLDAGIG